MSLLTEIILKEKSHKFNTKDKEIDEVGLTILEPRTQEVDPSTKVTLEEDV